MIRFFTLLLVLAACAGPVTPALACGFNFHGGCSTNIAFGINGTIDSFYVDDCPFGLPFQNMYLGDLQTLTLHKVKAATWESCINNVTSVVLHYRLYEVGAGGGAWSQLALSTDSVVLNGPYTTRYRGAYPALNLAAGLTPGRSYVFEVYFEADVDTIGDDFIAETLVLQNNNGANYRLTFHYGGPQAPPFTVVPNRVRPLRCHGDSTGVAGVSVYGNQSGLFFSWAGISNNFPTLYNVPAGPYVVTVTGAGGYAETDTVLVPAPPALALSVTGLQAVSCSGQAGQAAVAGGGGTPPYSFVWSNGATGPVLSSAVPGAWTVTLTDAAGCSAALPVAIPGSAPATLALSAEICQGQSYSFGNQLLSASGIYSTVLNPGNVTCDTIVQLELTVLDAAPLLAQLPDTLRLSCTEPQLELCLPILPSVQYVWWQGSAINSTLPCTVLTSPGQYTAVATLYGASALCTAARDAVVEADFEVPAAAVESLTVTDPQPCLTTAIDSLALTFIGHTTVPAATLTWLLDGQAVGTGDTLTLFYPAFEPGLSPLPAIVATSLSGCTSAPLTPAVEVVPGPVFTLTATVVPASGLAIADGALAIYDSAALGAVHYAWNTGDTTAVLEALLPGVYCVTATDGTGCQRDTCLEVSALSATTAAEDAVPFTLAPNPARAGTVLRLTCPSKNFSEAAVLLVHDGRGRLVARLDWPAGAAEIEIPVPADTPSGPFFLTILAERRALTLRGLLCTGDRP
jgi:hypothetical protein